MRRRAGRAISSTQKTAIDPGSAAEGAAGLLFNDGSPGFAVDGSRMGGAVQKMAVPVLCPLLYLDGRTLSEIKSATNTAWIQGNGRFRGNITLLLNRPASPRAREGCGVRRNARTIESGAICLGLHCLPFCSISIHLEAA